MEAVEEMKNQGKRKILIYGQRLEGVLKQYRWNVEEWTFLRFKWKLLMTRIYLRHKYCTINEKWTKINYHYINNVKDRSLSFLQWTEIVLVRGITSNGLNRKYKINEVLIVGRMYCKKTRWLLTEIIMKYRPKEK